MALIVLKILNLDSLSYVFYRHMKEKGTEFIWFLGPHYKTGIRGLPGMWLILEQSLTPSSLLSPIMINH